MAKFAIFLRYGGGVMLHRWCGGYEIGEAAILEHMLNNDIPIPSDTKHADELKHAAGLCRKKVATATSDVDPNWIERFNVQPRD